MRNDLASFRALHAVASIVNEGSGVQETLQRVLRAFCRESVWVSGAIMEADPGADTVRVVARYDPVGVRAEPERLWPLAQSPARVALETGRPVILPDARLADEYPGYRKEALERNYRTVVLLPMETEGSEHRDTVLAASSRRVIDVSERELAFLQLVVHLGSIAVAKARSLESERAFAERLDAVLKGNSALLDAVLNDESLAGLVGKLAEMIPDPFCVVDLTCRRVWARRSPWLGAPTEEEWAASADGDARPELLKLALGCKGDDPAIQIKDVMLRVGRHVLQARITLCSLRVDATVVGALIVFPDNARQGELDHLLLDAARCALSVHLMRAHVRFNADARKVEDLVLGLLEGSLSGRELTERAARLDMTLDQPGRLLVLAPASLASPAFRAETLRSVFDRARSFHKSAAAVVCRGQLVAIAPFRAKDETRWRTLVADALADVRLTTAQEVVAVSSSVCESPQEYGKAFQDCERLVQLARRFGRLGHVDEREFGAFPILLSALDAAEMRSFVGSRLGKIAQHDARRQTSYVETLSSYLDHGCRVQATAAALGLHVTTLRYRLTRMRELFGIEMETPDQRFALQLAMRFVTLVAPPSPESSPPTRRKQRVLASPGA